MFDGQGPWAGSRFWLASMRHLSGRPLERTFGLTARDTGGREERQHDLGEKRRKPEISERGWAKE